MNYPLPAHVRRYLDANPHTTTPELAAALDIGYASAAVYRSRWRVQQCATGPEQVWVTVVEVRITEEGFAVTYREPGRPLRDDGQSDQHRVARVRGDEQGPGRQGNPVADVADPAGGQQPAEARAHAGGRDALGDPAHEGRTLPN